MPAPALIDRANEVIERVFALDDAIANARAFRTLLEDLHARDLSIVEEPHVTAIAMVRAAILRAAISTVMACLDPSDRRGNRASVGQIIDMLKDAEIVAVFAEPGQPEGSGPAALQEVRRDYEALLKDDLFERGRRLRNEMIAHLLIPNDPTPTVSYETIYRLHDVAEGVVIGLYQVSHRGRPQFINHQARLIEGAKVFWDTYFAEISSCRLRRP
jgi:AbiU2